ADGKADEWIAGYFQSGEDVNYITISTEREQEETYGTIFHEYVHFMLNTSFGSARVPPWFNEGLAEYYQTYEIFDDQKVILGYVQDSHLNLLRQAKLIPLKQFFEVDNYSLHASGGHSRSIFYAQAWALMHYLIQGNQGANARNLDKFIALILRDVEPEAAFRQAFNSDYAAMEKDLRKYVQDGKYTASQFTMKQKLVFDSQMTVTPLAEPEANAYLGDLLLHTGEYADAETHLNKALAVSPNLGAARISLGLVKLRQRNFAEAKKNLETALAGDQKNHYAHYSYAYILSRESVDEFGMVYAYNAESLRKMKASLLKAIEINPQFAESYSLLGFISLVSGEDLDEALKTVNKGLAIQPGNPDHLLLRAKILMRQEKFADARAVAETVAKSTEKKSVRDEAENLINSIKQVEETKAAYETKVKETIAEIESNGGRVKIFGNNPPVILKRKDISDADIEKFEKERVLRNLNLILDPLREGYARSVGRIEKISCPKGKVLFNFTVSGVNLTLSAIDFQSIELTVLHEGTQNFEVGCEANLSDQLVVLTYKPAEKAKTGNDGIVSAITVVPNDFR
ncbi:MAG: tetratricopeptide repeat protein, partial [Pyrinomonadaceae bacterium]